jgi:hypothetical protein
MDDDQFVHRLKEKLERIADRDVDLRVDDDDPTRLEVDLDGPVPRVIFGRNIYDYPGFARMCLEYAVASISQGRHLGELEFHMLLARN